MQGKNVATHNCNVHVKPQTTYISVCWVLIFLSPDNDTAVLTFKVAKLREQPCKISWCCDSFHRETAETVLTLVWSNVSKCSVSWLIVALSFPGEVWWWTVRSQMKKPKVGKRKEEREECFEEATTARLWLTTYFSDLQVETTRATIYQ